MTLMDTTGYRTAVLFYRDGQVKFTQTPVEARLQFFAEYYHHPLSVEEAYSDTPVKEVPVYSRHFERIGNVSKYVIFEEV